jgi:hypothetical protein
MSPDIAKKLLPLVNVDKHTHALHAYAVERIAFLHRQLEIATSYEEVKELQGSLKEMRKFLTLKEEAHQKAKEK